MNAPRNVATVTTTTRTRAARERASLAVVDALDRSYPAGRFQVVTRSWQRVGRACATKAEAVNLLKRIKLVNCIVGGGAL